MFARARTLALCIVGAAAASGTAFACSGSVTTYYVGDDGGGATATSSGSGGFSSGGSGGGGACKQCLTDKDCSGGVCAQFAGDSYCAATCTGGAGCAADSACTTLSSAEGAEVQACVPRGNVCGGGSSGSSGGGSSGGASGSSGGGSGGSSGGSCGNLAPPSQSAGCHSCSGNNCQPNGCYGGWYCNTQTNKCQSPPQNGCGGGSGGSSGGSGSGSSSGGGGLIDGGVMGSVGPSGGSVSRLLFAVVGDTRPASTDDTQGYPTAVATQIYKDMAGMNPPPTFGVSTGDYMFASTNGGQAGPQLDLYIQARSNFANVMFPAMGNHECSGYTASNCGKGNADGITDNYTQFMNKLLQPLGQSSPYYSIAVDDVNGKWTAKFVFIAANAWDGTQSSWLSSTLAQQTTYTFIMRHEPAAANTAPGVDPSEQIMQNYPYTLAIVGHTHTYSKSGSKQVTVGNGGAPLSGNANYGFGLVQQRNDGTIQFDMYDYQSMQPDMSFEFAVNPDGTPAP